MIKQFMDNDKLREAFDIISNIFNGKDKIELIVRLPKEDYYEAVKQVSDYIKSDIYYNLNQEEILINGLAGSRLKIINKR
jgi:hypothetical protein